MCGTSVTSSRIMVVGGKPRGTGSQVRTPRSFVPPSPCPAETRSCTRHAARNAREAAQGDRGEAPKARRISQSARRPQEGRGLALAVGRALCPCSSRVDSPLNVCLERNKPHPTSRRCRIHRRVPPRPQQRLAHGELNGRIARRLTRPGRVGLTQLLSTVHSSTQTLRRARCPHKWLGARQ